LPVTLPDIEHYEPTDTGESPLAAITDWVNTTCPQCGGPAKRETDTMPNWAGSSWYYLRYMDPHNDQVFADLAKMTYWSPVDLYLGGMEHTTLHLLYSRFWHQFLFDQGLVPTPEPYAARRGQGIVLAPDNRKMSKSWGNVINPTDVIARYGADAFRLYIMFMAPYDETTPWSDERLNGVSRFVYRVWSLYQDVFLAASVKASGGPSDDSLNPGIFEAEVDRTTHKTIKKIHDDLEGMRFNTYVSTLMEYVNFLTLAENKGRLQQPQHAYLRRRTGQILVRLLAPAAPHLTEELWHELGEEGSVHTAAWPQYDPALLKDDLVTIVVQVNGKVRGQLALPPDATEAEVTAAAHADPNVAKHLAGTAPVKTVFVPRRLINLVVKPQ
jgi:leucyl-tRNA synthetase